MASKTTATSSAANAKPTANGKSVRTEIKRGYPDADDERELKRTKLPKSTDRTRWRLLDERGRQTWHYLEGDEELEEWPQSIADKYFLGLPTVGFQVHTWLD